jgi:thermostable 8-oxoguanine DNA glycosylase
MNTKSKQSLSFNGFKQGKFKKFNTQKATIFNYLQNCIATASMVSDATGIPQKSICRYKRDLEKRGLLFEVEKRFCKITGFRAWYLTTNKELFQKFNQSKTVK